MQVLFEIFLQFLILGATSFGGPNAHIAIFKKRFVDDLKWLNEEDFAKLLALSQFLPGPTSSQIGFAIGLEKGGKIGAFLAFIAFTLPSFLLMFFAAIYAFANFSNPTMAAILGGLKLFAIFAISDAAYSMYKNFCKETISRTIFALSFIFLIFYSDSLSQILVILGAFLFGYFYKNETKQNQEISYQKINLSYFLLFLALLLASFLVGNSQNILGMFFEFFKIGSLVFGGGHVVLPLIAQNLQIEHEIFLSGYSLAQSMPGPMFSIASFIGAAKFEQYPLLASLAATFGVFMPGFLLILAFYKSYQYYATKPKIASAISAINASVVAILAVTLANPMVFGVIQDWLDLAFLAIVFILNLKHKVGIITLIFAFCIFSVLNNLL